MIKRILLLLLLGISGIVSAQNDTIFYIPDSSAHFRLSVVGDKVSTSYINVDNAQYGFDTYTFFIQYDEEIGFAKSKKLLDHSSFTILTDDFFKSKNPCELHDFFSGKRSFFLVRKEADNFYGYWISYDGTSRNRVRTVIH